MTKEFLNGLELPFCKGCGHSHVAKSADRALRKLNFDPLDVVIVTDIGCHGIIDKNFLTHTAHGLHGRSIALGAGISAAMSNPKKKVIVFTGDGGATIGMQHLINAAHNGFDLTVIVHNNMLYGMTGGQPSDFTPEGFRTPTHREGVSGKGYDVCRLAVAAGASFVQRIVGMGDFSDALADAFFHKGFSLVEVLELCPSYGVKANPKMNLRAIAKQAGWDVTVFASGPGVVFEPPRQKTPATLLGPDILVETTYEHSLNAPLRVMVSGSASEGVQSAAELLAQAGMKSGLHVTKKGSYPVTVGVGFSSADVILSPQPILYSGSPVPDALVITSGDGLEYARARAARMQHGTVYLDASLRAPETGAGIVPVPFRNRAGARNAALYALSWFVQQSGVFPLAAMADAIRSDRIGAMTDVEGLMNSLSTQT